MLAPALACAPAVSAPPPSISQDGPRVAVAGFRGAEGRAELFLGWLRGHGFDARLVNEADARAGRLSGVDLLVVPNSRELPPSFWTLLPPFHAGGGHLIFEGVPLRTGQRGSDKFVPGIGPDLHLYFETGEHPGLPDAGNVELRSAEAGLPLFPGLPRTVEARGNGARSIQTFVHRYSRDVTGRREFREDLVRVPFGFFDPQGGFLAQQAVLVRHHCRHFRGVTTGFVDVTQGESSGHALLTSDAGAQVLNQLVRQAVAPFPGERSSSEYSQLSRLKVGLDELRREVVETEYVWRDLLLLARHASVPAKVVAEGRKLNTRLASALAILDAYHELRAGPPDLAWAGYAELSARAKQSAADLGALRKRLAAVFATTRDGAGRASVQLPGGNLVYGFASTPVRWGYRDGPMLAAMEQAGMESYTDWAFDATTLADRGGPLLSLYEFLKPLPSVKQEPWAKTGEHWTLDLASGGLSRSKRPVPVFDPVYESSEYALWLEAKASSHATERWINSRIITAEQVLRQEDAHGPGIQSSYRTFLKDRHGIILELNHRWGTTYRGFEDIESPRRFPETRAERANWFDFVDFRAKGVAGSLRRIADAYRLADARHAIVGSLNQQGPLSGVDFFAVNEVLDRVSSHNWPTSQPWYNPGLAARPGQRGENNELKATRAAYGWTPKSERGHQWRVRFYTLYTWAHGTVEQEEHHWGASGGARVNERGSGLIGEVDGHLRLPAAELGSLNRSKAAWEGFSGATAPHEWSQVGLYWSFATKSQGRGVPPHHRLGDDFFINAFLLNDRWNEWLDAAHVPFETVPRQKVLREELEGLRLIIVPQQPFLERKVVDGLLAWVKEGGHLLVVGNAGRFDEYASPVDGLLGPLGIVARAAPETPLLWEGRRLTAPRLHGPHQEGRDRLHFIGARGETLVRDASGRVAALAVTHGKGKLVVLGFSPAGEKRVAAGRLPAGESGLAFFDRILSDAAVKRVAWGRSPQDRLAVWRGGDGWFYGVVQNFSAERRDVELMIRGQVEKIVDVTLALPLRSQRRGGNTKVVVPLLEGDGRVLAWRLAEDASRE